MSGSPGKSLLHPVENRGCAGAGVPPQVFHDHQNQSYFFYFCGLLLINVHLPAALLMHWGSGEAGEKRSPKVGKVGKNSFSQSTLISIEFPGPSWEILIPSCSPLDSAGRWNSLRSARPASVQRPKDRSTRCWRCSWLSAPPSSTPSSRPPSPSRQTLLLCTGSPWPGWTGTRQPRSVFPPTSHISDRTAYVFSINATALTYFAHLGYFNDYLQCNVLFYFNLWVS